MWTREQVARTIDHAVLNPFATDRDIIEACAVGRRCGVATVIVRPTDVPLMVLELEGSGVTPGTTVSFPHGADPPEVKALAARLALEAGVGELDMMMNLGRFLNGDQGFVRKDIEGVVAEAGRRGALVKVILETCYLSPEQIALACRIARDAGAHFVKTSTGFGEGPATPAAVRIMVDTVGESMGVKAAAGIRDWDTAVRYLDLGCTRLGVRATGEVLRGGGPAATPTC
ncbi:MAG: deoxyribose-phosphate aldolase [Spirochaetota bacterium]